jgi:hypothetical protein
MQPTAHGLFGQICVESGYVTQEQIAECVRIQAQLGNRHNLGALLVHRGYLTEEQLEEIMRRQRESRAPPPAAVRGSPEGSWTPLEAPPTAPPRQPGTAVAPGIGARPLAAGSRLAALLHGAERRRASDLHLHPGTPLALLRSSRRPPSARTHRRPLPRLFRRSPSTAHPWRPALRTATNSG